MDELDPAFKQHLAQLFATRQPVETVEVEKRAPRRCNVIRFPRASKRIGRMETLTALIYSAIADMENHGLKSLVEYYEGEINNLPAS